MFKRIFIGLLFCFAYFLLPAQLVFADTKQITLNMVLLKWEDTPKFSYHNNQWFYDLVTEPKTTKKVHISSLTNRLYNKVAQSRLKSQIVLHCKWNIPKRSKESTLLLANTLPPYNLGYAPFKGYFKYNENHGHYKIFPHIYQFDHQTYQKIPYHSLSVKTNQRYYLDASQHGLLLEMSEPT